MIERINLRMPLSLRRKELILWHEGFIKPMITDWGTLTKSETHLALQRTFSISTSLPNLPLRLLPRYPPLKLLLECEFGRFASAVEDLGCWCDWLWVRFTEISVEIFLFFSKRTSWARMKILSRQYSIAEIYCSYEHGRPKIHTLTVVLWSYSFGVTASPIEHRESEISFICVRNSSTEQLSRVKILNSVRSCRDLACVWEWKWLCV